MKVLSRLGLPGLLLAVALVLASCAGADGSAQQEDGGSSGDEQQESEGGDVQGMDHGEMSGMEGMDESSMNMGQMAQQMVIPDGEYSDERFIDAMVPHHQGAIEMAEVALENAEHPELLQLAENVISAQQAEIEELRSIKGQEFGTSEVPTQISPEEMEMMRMEDPAELANQRPFDEAFINAMIPHHESAIEMAQVALAESANPTILDLAGRIVEDQSREIEQMEQWREEWYPGG